MNLFGARGIRQLLAMAQRRTQQKAAMAQLPQVVRRAKAKRLAKREVIKSGVLRERGFARKLFGI